MSACVVCGGSGVIAAGAWTSMFEADDCSHCKGTGVEPEKKQCPFCQGSGFISSGGGGSWSMSLTVKCGHCGGTGTLLAISSPLEDDGASIGSDE